MDIVSRIIYSLFTLYMLVVLVRWTSPVLHIELEVGRMVWVKKITEPSFQAIRKVFPAIGPFDLTALVVLFVLWFLRTITLNLLNLPQ